MTPQPPPEFSRPLPVDRLGAAEQSYELVADTQECEALARRFGILGVAALSATVHVRRIGGVQIVRLHGGFRADVAQTCVVTLEPVPAHIEETFDMTFGEAEDEGDEIILDPLGDDPPDPIVAGIIDMGEAVAEHLALALDPFPRAPGAAFEGPGEDKDEPRPPNPFAALAKLKGKAQ